MKYKLKKWWEKSKDFVFLPAYLLLVAVLAFLAWLAFARPKPATASADYSTPPSHSYPLDGIYCITIPEDVEFQYSGTSFTDGLAYLTLTVDFATPVCLYSGDPNDGFADTCPVPVLYYEDLGNILSVTYQSYVYYSAFDFIVDYAVCGLTQEGFASFAYVLPFTTEYYPIGGGYEMGYESGYFAGKSDGLIAGREEGRNEVYEWYENELAVKQQAFDEALEKGKKDAYDEGYAEGELGGYDLGYGDGYLVGTSDAINNTETFLSGIYSIFDAPVRVLRESFNFELFGINVADAVFFVLTGFVVILVIKKVKGG